MSGLISRSVSFRKELAYLDGIKAFEDNVSGKSVLTYTSDMKKALYYANHWDIYPSDVEAYRRGEFVEPVKPIVFYVDSAFPEDDPEFDPDNLRK